MESEKLTAERLLKFTRDNNCLLPAQEQAALSEAPLTLVSAGAGTGKTYTLSWRFLRALLREGVRPRDILTLSFKNLAQGHLTTMRQGVEACQELRT